MTRGLAAVESNADDAIRLEPGESVERKLDAGQEHAYRFEPGHRKPLRLLAEQRGIDVEIQIDRAGGDSFVVDSPFDRRGREAVLLAGSGSYRITLRGREPGAPPGRYALLLEAVGGDASEDGTGREGMRLAAVRAVSAASRLYRQGSPEAWSQAAEQHRLAVSHWRALDERRETASSLYALAVLLRLIDKPREALEAASEAVDLFRALGDPLLEAYAGNELGLDHWRLGDLDAARQTFESSSALQDRHGDAFIVASAASNRCLLHLSRGQLAAGRKCYEGSLPSIERARSAQIESAARTNLARLAEHLGEPEDALEHYRRALELLAGAGEQRSRARTLNNLGVLLRGLGDLDAAMARYAEAADVFERIGEPRWQARVLNNVGFAYRSLGEPRRALVSFERALQLFRQAEDRRGEAATLSNLGLAKRDLDRLREALELHRQALAIRRQDGRPRDLAVALRRIGEVHAELGETDAATSRLGEAVTLASELGDRLIEAKARRGLGQVHAAAGDLDAARKEMEAALELVAGSGRRTAESEILMHLARVEREAGRIAEARRHVAAALERLEDLRARIDGPDLRTSYSSLLRGAYELDADLLMSAHRADPEGGHDRRALEVAERARGRALLELLQEADVDLTAGARSTVLERRQRFGRRLAAKTERLADPELDGPSRETLEAEQLALLHRLEVIDAEIRRQSPAYAEIVRPRALAAREIEALTDPDTTLAVYLLAEPRSYLWRVAPESTAAFELPRRTAIETAARRVHSLWSELDATARARDHAAAEELAEMLRLRDLLGSRRLAIVADGALHVVPFAALPIPAREPAGVPEPLVNHTDVVALPSVSVLALDRRRPAADSRRRSVAILADPAFGPDHPALPASRREAEAIAEAVSPSIALLALGFDANREWVESDRLRDHAFLHFATHGWIDTTEPSRSGLMLSGVDAAGRPRPHLLHLRDVYNLRLDAELVVLSGCRTALGPVVRGEGLIGLARGFMYAGSRRVLASLWQVEDHATARLMTSFYRALWRHELPPSAALAAAQRELSRTRRFRDPYYWAGFVLVGDWR